MKYIMLIYANEAESANATPEQQMAVMEAHNQFSAEHAQKGYKFGGEALHPTNAATTVRVRDDKTMTTDGPFAETREALGGYYIFDCKDLDEAIKVAEKIPEAKHGSVEIRPIVVFE